MSQVPSDRRVITVPSGRVTLAVANAWPSVEPTVAEVPVLDDDVVAVDDVVPPPERVVVVRPSAFVDDDTLPPPAVTDVDKLLLVAGSF